MKQDVVHTITLIFWELFFFKRHPLSETRRDYSEKASREASKRGLKSQPNPQRFLSYSRHSSGTSEICMTFN